MTGTHRRHWGRLAVVSWGGFAAMAPYSLVSMFLSNADLGRASVPSRVALAVGAQFILFGILFVGKAVLHRQSAIGSVAVVVLFAFASAIRAVAVAMVLAALGVTSGIDWTRRLPAAVLGFTAALLVLNTLLGFVVVHREREARLRHNQLAARLARDTSVEEVREQRDEIVSRVRAEIHAVIGGRDGGDAQVVAADLRRVADDLVRPLSHELAGTAPLPGTPPAPTKRSYSIGDLMLGAAAPRPLSPTLVVALFVVFGGPFLLVSLPPGKAAAVLALGAVGAWLLLAAADEILARVPVTSNAARFALACALSVLAGVLLAASTPWTIGGPEDVVRRVALADVLLIPIISVVLLLLRGAAAQQRQLEAKLMQSEATLKWETARVRCVQWREQHQLARAMHGPLQSAIGLGILRLESPPPADHSHDSLVHSVREQIMASVVSLEGSPESDERFDQTLRETADTWQGICDVSWSMSDNAAAALRCDHVAAAATTAISTEACWNAIRHGHAEKVRVTVRLADDRTIHLVVRNDGGAPAPEGQDRPAGLGTRMLTDMTIDREIRRVDGWTVVSASIPTVNP